ncbi:hypothetical protein EVAR_33594_1 [Eumeta japonica]|uniref:Uncharacterized protein n=1 Tax=Eumeta variegata TaxID=151549 RepID=A0A4C1W920_EUMVA|nr:hypothetical protein EVAR_33594_1 [Eumeta japonica]
MSFYIRVRITIRPEHIVAPNTDNKTSALRGNRAFPPPGEGLRLGVTLKSVTLGNVTMSHRTREARRMPCVSLPLNYDRSAARAALEN